MHMKNYRAADVPHMKFEVEMDMEVAETLAPVARTIPELRELFYTRKSLPEELWWWHSLMVCQRTIECVEYVAARSPFDGVADILAREAKRAHLADHSAREVSW